MLKIKAILSFQVIMVFNLLSQTPLFKFINNNYIQVDSNDQRISDYTFNDVDYMRRELTAVRIDDNWGYVNYKGELVIPLMYLIMD